VVNLHVLNVTALGVYEGRTTGGCCRRGRQQQKRWNGLASYLRGGRKREGDDGLMDE